jgi:hypothetical protein
LRRRHEEGGGGGMPPTRRAGRQSQGGGGAWVFARIAAGWQRVVVALMRVGVSQLCSGRDGRRVACVVHKRPSPAHSGARPVHRRGRK